MAYRRLSMSPGEALQTEIPEARRMENYRSGNCLLSYFDPNTKKFRNFTASQFGDVWNHFDQDDMNDAILTDFISIAQMVTTNRNDSLSLFRLCNS
uniref:Uncharacterized protein n=1 Tax=Schistosoma haematobium TaxID=6185 RepID=A0A095ARE4_SCHHA